MLISGLNGLIPLPGKLIFSAGCLASLTARLVHCGSSATVPVGAGWLSVQSTRVGRGSMGTCR